MLHFRGEVERQLRELRVHGAHDRERVTTPVEEIRIAERDMGYARGSWCPFEFLKYASLHSAEKYLVYHSTQKRPCGQLIVVDDGYDLFLSLILYPSFVWDEPAYHLEGDPEGRSFAELLVDVVTAEVIEPWGGGKWHLEIFRSVNQEPEDWNGEM